MHIWLLKVFQEINPKSTHQRCSVKKGVLRNFAKFTGKHLCQGLFSNKVACGAFEIQKQKHPLEKSSAVLTKVFQKSSSHVQVS